MRQANRDVRNVANIDANKNASIDANIDARGGAHADGRPVNLEDDQEGQAEAATPLGIQAVEQGFNILQAVAESRTPLTMTELAAQCGMSKSQLHRYLISLRRVGLLNKGSDLRYSLGTEAIVLGLKASAQIDLQSKSETYLNRMNERFNETAALAIWSESGPFFIRWQESNRSVKVGINVGSRVSLTNSATGMVFCAHMPPESTRPLLELENRLTPIDWDTFERDLEIVRASGFAATEGGFIPGIAAIAVPVFDQIGKLAAALTLVGVIGVLPVSRDSVFTQTMKQYGDELSSELGYIAGTSHR